MRVLALDFGTVRVGVAVSDEQRQLARPLKAIKVRGWKKDREIIRQLLTEYGVSEIVVGLPLNMDGTRGAAAERVQRLINRLHGFFRLPVTAFDERLSTVQADETLRTLGIRRDRRKALIDSVAAAIILQDYLDQIAQQGRRTQTGEESNPASDDRAASPNQRPDYVEGD